MVRQTGPRPVVVAAFWVVMAAASAMAQEGGGTVTEAVTTRRDLNGKDAVIEKVVTHRTRFGDEERIVVETYLPATEEGRLRLSRRVGRISTMRDDGGETVEETAEHNPAAPGEPLRITRRSVTTVRTTGAGSSVVERQDFERDLNGRLVLVDRFAERVSRD